MDFKNYYAALSKEQKEAFAEKCGSSRGHLQNVAYGYRTCSPQIASAIQTLTKGIVTRKDMRPNDWQVIWPELAKKVRA